MINPQKMFPCKNAVPPDDPFGFRTDSRDMYKGVFKQEFFLYDCLMEAMRPSMLHSGLPWPGYKAFIFKGKSALKDSFIAS